ncbi:MAG: hypothetical protein ACYSW3_00470 [Planctomycetota bacterium]|jgi:hypothetical protein
MRGKCAKCGKKKKVKKGGWRKLEGKFQDYDICPRCAANPKIHTSG